MGDFAAAWRGVRLDWRDAVRAVELFDSGLAPGVEMVVALAELARRKYHHEC